MSAPKPPPDNTLALEQMRQAAAEKVRQEEKAAAEAKAEKLRIARGQAGVTGKNNAMSYFSNKGLDPGQYGSEIDAIINSIMGGIAEDDPNPGSYFTNVGQTAYDTATTNFQNKNTQAIDKLFSPNFETTKIPWTMDDPYLAAIEAEEMAEADNYIKNLLSRGVITNAGYSAAKKNIEGQSPGVKAKLNEIGTSTLAEGQSKLKGIASKGKQTASTAALGTPFDAFTFSNEADLAFDDFVKNLSSTLKGKAPQDLFSTVGLGAIAGAGQGAQNMAFDPDAMAGIVEEDTDEEDKPAESIF